MRTKANTPIFQMNASRRATKNNFPKWIFIIGWTAVVRTRYVISMSNCITVGNTNYRPQAKLDWAWIYYRFRVIPGAACWLLTGNHAQAPTNTHLNCRFEIVRVYKQELGVRSCDCVTCTLFSRQPFDTVCTPAYWLENIHITPFDSIALILYPGRANSPICI